MVHPSPSATKNGDPAASAWILRPDASLTLTRDGPLAGLRFAVKDNIDVAHTPTTAGCPAFAYTPRAHAEVVRRLLEAGATWVGKTNLDQFACGLNGTRSPYGAVPNPFDARYIAGGSSSGSAYVVATGQVDFALGTDTAGSGRVPAALQNIVGLKPSRGAISSTGVVPASPSVDCVSIFASTVALASRVLAVCVGYDERDPYSRTLEWRDRPFASAFRFGVLTAGHPLLDTLNHQAYARSIERLQSLGGTAVPIDFEPFAQVAALLYDSALVAERYMALRTFFDGHAHDVVEPVRTILAQGRQYRAADLCEAQHRLKALAQRTRATWDAIDVLVLPTVPTHYTIAQMTADPVALNRNLGAFTNFVNLLDCAALAVPSTIRADGLPFGITFIGPAGSDWQLAQLGQRYHHSTGLCCGAGSQPLPAPQVIRAPMTRPTVRVAVVGAHLSGMPLNGQLIERGATLVQATSTAAHYRLYALGATVPPKPGLVRVRDLEGAPIAVEIWDMPLEHYGSFVALIPRPLGIGTLELADGSSVQGFLCEAQALTDAHDITAFGGWRAYLESQAAPA